MARREPLANITSVIAGCEHNLCYILRSMSTSTERALGVRDRLVAAALTVLERDGLSAIQARTLAAEIGASTMAVYTHFGGMPTLIQAVVREGFARFADHTRAAPQTSDSVADLVVGGLAYADFAMRNPRLYRVLFGLSEFDSTPQISGAAVWNLAEGIDALSVLVDAVERVIAAGRIRPQEPRLGSRPAPERHPWIRTTFDDRRHRNPGLGGGDGTTGDQSACGTGRCTTEGRTLGHRGARGVRIRAAAHITSTVIA